MQQTRRAFSALRYSCLLAIVILGLMSIIGTGGGGGGSSSFDDEPVTYYRDGDADGYGNPDALLERTSQPQGYVTDNTDCDDTNASINPDATEICGDAIDNDCDGQTDEDCNNGLTTYYRDGDTDGHGDPDSSLQSTSQPQGYVTNNTDCDDTDATIYSGAEEVCHDYLDNDCDGQIDEDCDNGIIVTLAVENNFLLPGTTTTVTATVTDSEGVPVPDGSVVQFAVTNPSIAELNALSANTTDGVATVTLTGNAEGTVGVSATFDAGKGSLSVTVAQATALPPDSLTLTASSYQVIVGRNISITALVSDTTGGPVADGTLVYFSMNTEAFGSLSPKSGVTANGSGTAITTFFGEHPGEVEITAQSGSVSTTITISVLADVWYLSLATSKTAIQTDNVDVAVITATALDANRVPVASVPVAFSATAGQISASTVVTDGNGEATIELTSGPDKENQVVTITATALNYVWADIPVKLTGTTVTLAIGTTSLQGLPVPTTTTLTITVKDGGGATVYDAPVMITQSSPGSGNVFFKNEGASGSGTPNLTGDTDVNGQWIVTVIGNNAGADPVTITVNSLGAYATVDVTVSD